MKITPPSIGGIRVSFGKVDASIISPAAKIVISSFVLTTGDVGAGTGAMFCDEPAAAASPVRMKTKTAKEKTTVNKTAVPLRIVS